MCEILFLTRSKFGTGGVRLKAYLTLIDCTVKQAATELNIDIKEVKNWIEQTSRPNKSRRISIEHWSGGYVPASSWGEIRHAPQHQDGPLPKRLKPPKTRAECINGPRPCPRLACKYHLWNDSKSSFRDGLPEESCALDISDRGSHTLEEIGVVIGLTKERVRQIESVALIKLRARLSVEEKSVAADEDT